MDLDAVIQAAAAFAKPWEGLRLEAYQDSAGVWTCGWGHTANVEEGDTCTETEALAWLEDDLQEAAKGLDRAWPMWRKLPLNRAVALLDFAFNAGPAYANPKHSLGLALRGMGTISVADAFRLYTRAGTSHPAGLVKRRAAEAELWSQEETT